MSISQPLWDAEMQGWRGEVRDTYRIARRRPWLRRLVRRKRARPQWLWSRRRRIKEQPAVGWNQSAQEWDTGSPDAAPFWSTARTRYGRALVLLLAAGAVTLLAGWWSAVLFLVWTSLVTTGVTTVRRQAAMTAGALGGRDGDLRYTASATPERAFAEGVLTVLMLPRPFAAARERSLPDGAPPPRGSGEPHVAEAVRDVCARLAAAARAGEDIS
ncbi:hypothetical protein GCM10010297_17580 [Streptomyces malachitofuscus]|nr:hypothetical protein GCM10010297_17580 [Streptomyces malachitofuscus]